MYYLLQNYVLQINDLIFSNDNKVTQIMSNKYFCTKLCLNFSYISEKKYETVVFIALQHYIQLLNYVYSVNDTIVRRSNK